MRTPVRTIVAALIVASVSAAPVGAGAATAARAPSRLSYHCTLAVTDLGSHLRVAYRLTSDGPGQRWHVRLWDDTIRFFSEDVKADTGGGFKVVARTEDRKGLDHLRGGARHLVSGRACTVMIDG